MKPQLESHALGHHLHLTTRGSRSDFLLSRCNVLWLELTKASISLIFLRIALIINQQFPTSIHQKIKDIYFKSEKWQENLTPLSPFLFIFPLGGEDKITYKYNSVPNIQSLLQALNFEMTLRTWNISFPIEKGVFRLKYHVSGSYKAAHARVPFPQRAGVLPHTGTVLAKTG